MKIKFLSGKNLKLRKSRVPGWEYEVYNKTKTLYLGSKKMCKEYIKNHKYQ